MARGTKTGGRPFTKGNPGRLKGAKDRVPRASIRGAIRAVAAKDPALFETILRKGLGLAAPSNFRYLELCAHYLDGKPTQAVAFDTDQPLKVITIVPPAAKS